MRRAEPGPDGRLRCPWALSSPEYVDYHDTEWGRPVTEDDAMFERITLEGFQSGLSWLIILRKRPGFRVAFDNFEIKRVSEYDDNDIARLMQDAGIVRNRQKITATINNARIASELPHGLLAHVLTFAPSRPALPPKELTDVRSESAESRALAKDLRKRGFRFIGPTTAYATMQATGVVDDHLVDCFLRGAFA